MRLASHLDLRSRRGVAYVVLVVVLLPLVLTMMVYVFDGLAMIVAYRRAQGLATVGVQAATATAQFEGNAVTLPNSACAAAVNAICANSGVGCASGQIRTACALSGNVVSMRVGVRPSLSGSHLGLNISYASATVNGGPRFGVHYGE